MAVKVYCETETSGLTLLLSRGSHFGSLSLVGWWGLVGPILVPGSVLWLLLAGPCWSLALCFASQMKTGFEKNYKVIVLIVF